MYLVLLLSMVPTTTLRIFKRGDYRFEMGIEVEGEIPEGEMVEGDS